jgi:hypothetical protein
MSRGLSLIQRTIVAMLEGRERLREFASGSLELTTNELLEELEARDLVKWDRPRKQRMATVFRACRSLVTRGVIVGTRVPDCDNPGRHTVCWRAA